MAKKHLLSVIGLIIILNSCNTVFEEHQDVDDLQWYENDKKTFEVDISERGKYDVYFALRYATGFPYKVMKINVIHSGPDGSGNVGNIKFSVVDNNNQYIGEVVGDIWDLEHKFIENQELKEGTHIFEIRPALNNSPAIAVMEVGLIVKKH